MRKFDRPVPFLQKVRPAAACALCFHSRNRLTKTTVLLCLVSLALSGCWDNREPERMVRSLLVAFDLDDRGFYEVTSVFANPLFQAGGEGGGGGGTGAVKLPFWVHSARGRTPFEAVLNLSPATSRIIMFSHSEILLFSERLARRGIGPVIDLYQRSRELRLTVLAAVVDGDLKELLAAEYPLEFQPSTALNRLLRLISSDRSTTPEGQLLKRIIELTRPGEDILLPRIKVLTPEKPGGSGQQGRQSPPPPPVEILGAAVFRGEKMAGWMDGHETRGQNWIKGEMERGPVIVEMPGDRGLATIELTKMRSEIRPVVKNGEITVTVHLNIAGRLQDLAVPPGRHPVLDQDLVRHLQNGLAGIIRRDCERSLTRARELGADIFGFGNAVYRKDPRLWQESAAGRWEELFQELPVEILVTATVTRPGLILSPFVPQR